jgi:rubrerythrin
MTDRSADGAGSPATATRGEQDLGGDPACWLNRVCDACGRFVDDPLAEVCPACGARRDA